MLEEIAALPISRLPSRVPVEVPVTARMQEVVEAMHLARQGAVLVVDGDELVGIFSERDLIQRVDHADASWRAASVTRYMTARPMIVREDDTLAEALRRMQLGKRRHLPIVRGKVAVGIVSIRDILGYVAKKFPGHFINLPPDPDHEARELWGG